MLLPKPKPDYVIDHTRKNAPLVNFLHKQTEKFRAAGATETNMAWTTKLYCTCCDREVSYYAKMYSHGRCPHCGHKGPGSGTIMATTERGVLVEKQHPDYVIDRSSRRGWSRRDWTWLLVLIVAVLYILLAACARPPRHMSPSGAAGVDSLLSPFPPSRHSRGIPCD